MRPAPLPAALAALLARMPSAVCALAAAGACVSAGAAVDDQVGPFSPVAAPEGFVAAARRLVDETMATERAVVAAVRDSVVSRVMASSWRLNLGTPYAPSTPAVASRGSTGDDADTPTPEALDLSLGARWRVLHGDANSHVPSAAWMPDLQAADVRASALRPTMSLSGEWSLPNDFTLGMMPGMVVDYSMGHRQATGTFALTLGKSWTPQWRTFVDMARDRLGAVQLTGVSTSVDAGVSFVAMPGTQIDFAVTRGLSDTAPPFQAGLGLSSTF
jgi:hypothetical protein